MIFSEFPCSFGLRKIVPAGREGERFDHFFSNKTIILHRVESKSTPLPVKTNYSSKYCKMGQKISIASKTKRVFFLIVTFT